jgi:hypothetical protein
MAIMDKLKFWKKHDTFADLDKELGTLDQHPTPKDDLGLPTLDPMGSSGLPKHADPVDMSFGMTPPNSDDPFGRPTVPKQRSMQQTQSVQQTQPMQQDPQIVTQLDLISAKIETIKVSLESINHRLLAVERGLHLKDYQDTSQPRRRRGVW